MHIYPSNELSRHKHLLNGKIRGLFELMNSGLNVPSFYVFNGLISDNSSVTRVEITACVEEWMDVAEIDPNSFWAVRSSHKEEDGTNKSNAGRFVTVLNVQPVDIPAKILEVVDAYNKVDGKHEEVSIILQQMLTPDYSGVFFTKNPAKPYSAEAVGEIIPGLGDIMVNGERNGVRVNFTENNVDFDFVSDTIEGECVSGDARKRVMVKKEMLKDATANSLQQLHFEALSLEKKLDYPLDIEFAIENGTLYWLQVRPITTRKRFEDFEVWDNSSVEANFPGKTLPLTIDFMKHSMGMIYFSVATKIGFSKRVLALEADSFNNMSGEIQGQLFYNINCWQRILYHLPFGKKWCLKLPQLWGMNATNFQPLSYGHSKGRKLLIGARLLFILLNEKKYRKNYEKTLADFVESKDPVHEELEELTSIFSQTEKELSSSWLPAALNGFYTMVFSNLLERALKNSTILDQRPNFKNDILFSAGDVISLQIVNSFHTILEQLKSEGLISKLRSYPPRQFLDFLSDHHQSIYNRILTHISEYGNRIDEGELKLEAITYKDDPLKFIEYLKTFSDTDHISLNREGAFNYKAFIAKHYRMNFLKKNWLIYLSKSYIKRIKQRENDRFYRTQTIAKVRNLVLLIGKKLTEKRFIKSKRDVFYLQRDELMDVENYKLLDSIVGQRKMKYRAYSAENNVNRYFEVNDKFYPSEDQIQRLNRGELKGTGCCSGIVYGKVVTIDRENLDERAIDFSDAILVAPYFSPGDIGYLSKAKGIISERGNLLSHTAILTREMNIPSIVGINGLLDQVKEGMNIKMDGATGSVEIMENDV